MKIYRRNKLNKFKINYPKSYQITKNCKKIPEKKVTQMIIIK